MGKFYITFGQSHVHRVQDQTLDADCVAVITAATHWSVRLIAFRLFGNEFCTSCNAADFTTESMTYYPRGLIRVN